MWQDLRFGIRTLAKNPGFSLVAVVALALGIGANATVFSLANAILFKSLPFADSDKILYLSTVNLRRSAPADGISLPDYQDLRSQTRSMQALGAYTRMRANLSDDSTVPDSYGGAQVTANTFAVLGQPPILGRPFETADERPGAPAVVALSHTLWQTRYGGDRSVIGKTVRLNSSPAIVVAVLAKGVLFPPESDFWLPLIPDGTEKRRDPGYTAFGKVAPGYTREQAKAEINGIAAQLERQYPESNKDRRFALQSFQEVSTRGPIRVVFLVLLGAVGFVLLIACANVANLMLSRAVRRSREISIRAALGAGRWRVIRQLLAESLLLSAAGGAAGLAIAQWGTRAFDKAVIPTGKPAWIDFSMDFRAFGYLAAISIVTAVVFGLAPALRLSRLDVNTALKDGGRGLGAGIRGRYLSGVLVVVEMTLAVVLLAGAGLMIRSFLWAYSSPAGFRTDHLLTMRLDLPEKKYATQTEVAAFRRQLTDRLRALPGVQAAAMASALPANGSASVDYGTADSRSSEKRSSTHLTLVSDGYFEAMGTSPLRGRFFSVEEHAGGPPVAVINETLAKAAWPGEDPLGKRLQIYRKESPGPWVTVIGVVPDMARSMQRQEPEPMLFEPFRQETTPARYTAGIARTRVQPESLGQAFRREVQSIDRDLPVREVSTMEDLLALNRWPLRVFGAMFSIFAAIALLLATVGLYAVTAYGVSLRRQEIGVRVALGASAGSILAMVFRSGMRQAGIGLALGLAAAYGVTRVLKALLTGVSPTDPVTFGSVAGILLAAAISGCAIPARRAMKVDPVVALRHE